jgi:hypothetical protein
MITKEDLGLSKDQFDTFLAHMNEQKKWNTENDILRKDIYDKFYLPIVKEENFNKLQLFLVRYLPRNVNITWAKEAYQKLEELSEKENIKIDIDKIKSLKESQVNIGLSETQLSELVELSLKLKFNYSENIPNYYTLIFENILKPLKDNKNKKGLLLIKEYYSDSNWITYVVDSLIYNIDNNV